MFDSGVLYICDLVDTAEKGDAPKQQLKRKNKFWFEQRYIGVNRQYLAKGVQEQIDLLVRIHDYQDVSVGQYVVLGNGDQFRITMVNKGYESMEYTRMADKHYYKTARIVGLNYTELTLQRMEDNYDVAD